MAPGVACVGAGDGVGVAIPAPGIPQYFIMFVWKLRKPGIV